MNAGRHELQASAAAGEDWQITGNHYLALPAIRPRDGALDRLNVLHRGHNGLLEWAGARTAGGGPALLTPGFRIGDVDVAVEAGVAWERVERWIPRFRGQLTPELTVTGTICAPGGAEFSYPGAVYHFELENQGRSPVPVDVRLAGEWCWSLRTVQTSRPFGPRNRLWYATQPRALVLEQGAGGPALAVVAGGMAECEAEVANDGLRPLAGGEELDTPNGTPLRFAIARRVEVPARGRAHVAFYLGVGLEQDGARAAARYLERIGAAELIREGRLALARMTRRTSDKGLTSVFNRNLLFNFFYAVGRALDDDRLYGLASRSTLNPRAASFSERDALLWSLPALTLVDAPTARELLHQAFERYSQQPGQVSHYLDGSVLVPGFALDQCCAYVLALDLYVRESGDRTILEEPLVQQVLLELQEVILSRLHPEIFLCATEVQPSGDRPDHAFLTYDNALVAATGRALDRVWIALPGGDAKPPLDGAAEEITSALWRSATAEVEGLRLLAWSSNLEGESAVYDDPAGSLQLLPHFGFCELDDPIWRDTVDWLRSPGYPLWLEGAFPGLASRRSPRLAALSAVCADLLGARRDEALALLRRLPLDGGIACESYDPATGKLAGGRHYAALAGFLAWSLWQALES